MIKNLILIGLIYIIYRMAKSWIQTTMQSGSGGPLTKGTPDGPADGVMIKDPQCGVYFPQQDAVVLKQSGETLYFCSEKCRDDYKKNSK